MFGLFSDRKTKLEQKYQRLLKEAYDLSHVDRKKADEKTAEADRIREEIDALEGKG